MRNLTSQDKHCRKCEINLPPALLALLCLVLCLAAPLAHAQEQKIIATTSQQYQNLIRNASFESWSQGTSAIPDAWIDVNMPTYLKLTADKRAGTASLKVTAAGTGAGLNQVVSVEPNTAYTVSFYYKVDTGGSCTFNVSGAAALVNQTGLNSTTWKRMSYTFITGASDTSITAKMTANGAYVFYIDGIILTQGHQAPAYAEHILIDTGDQTVYGDIKVQDTDSTNYILLDKDTGNITLTGTVDGVDISTHVHDGTAVGGQKISASNVTSTSSGNLSATNVQSALEELQLDIDTREPLITAGAGLTKTGSTLDVGAGTGITVNPDDVAINLTYTDGRYVNEGQADSITSAMLTNGEIVNADINASAAIAGTKISPDFGAQNIVTTGNLGIGTTGPLQKLHVEGQCVTGDSLLDIVSEEVAQAYAIFAVDSS